MATRLQEILSQVFGAPSDRFTDDSSPDSIETWDSLTHVNLVLALEEEFDVALTPEDALEMMSVGLIRTILREKGAPVDEPA